jgi:hypothetical protein
MDNIRMDKITFHKMSFIINALEKGWTVKKQNDEYIFSKKHENRREIFKESYLREFLETNMQLPEVK